MSDPAGTVLTPVRERYATWLALDESEVERDREEDPEQLRALQLLLRLERGDPPSWHRALELSASACARLCLDPRSAPGGEWHEAVAAYCAGHIRKVTRRGRGAQWRATEEVPGLTLTDGDRTEVRALVPGLVSEVDRRVAKLQIGGTDLPVDETPVAVGPEPHLTIHVPATSTLTAGKLMAQTGHAGMIAAALLEQDDESGLRAWYDPGCPCRIARTSDHEWATLRGALADPLEAWSSDRLLAVRDAGFTEVASGTMTAIARFSG